MNFTISSITSEDVGSLVNQVTMELERKLAPVFAGGNFGDGVDQVSIIVVAFSDDVDENEKTRKQSNRMSRYKHFLTGETVRCMTVAVGFPPGSLAGLDESSAKALLITALLDRIQDIEVRSPKAFKREEFVETFRQSLISV